MTATWKKCAVDVGVDADDPLRNPRHGEAYFRR